MKKATLTDKLITGLFCGFLAVMCLMYLILPKEPFSEREKRELAAFPRLTWQTLTSGEFGTDMETYMADHIPGRDFFVGLGAYYDLLTGRQPGKDIYPAAGGRLVEAPVVWDPVQAEKNMRYINQFVGSIGQEVDLMLVPSAGFMLEDTIRGLHDPYSDDTLIQNIYGLAGEKVRCFDAVGLFQGAANRQDLYYRTDHHWTSYGAYTACRGYLDKLGRPYPGRDAFTVTTEPDFRGSTYSRSALWLTPGENIEMWRTDAKLLVEVTGEPVHEGAFYSERLAEADKYTVFLGGNRPLVRIRNEAGNGKLLVIRDSYANCLGPFLAESYGEVVMVDLRYYKKPISRICQEEDFDNILILYSIGNFMTDTNLPFLR